MGADAHDATREPAHLGYSVGRWEDETLVVRTTDISALEFDDRGAPQTPAIELEEHFTVSEDGNRLDYRLLISDPGGIHGRLRTDTLLDLAARDRCRALGLRKSRVI